jgi:hypothetical protein
MTFEEALSELKSGKKISRLPHCFISLEMGAIYRYLIGTDKDGVNYISNKCIYQPDCDDLLSNDWFVIG